MTGITFITSVLCISLNAQNYNVEKANDIQFNTDHKTIVEGNNKFAIELYKKITKSDQNNFISPYSISSALAMTFQGAGGETEKCMRNVLYFGVNDAKFHKSFNELNEKISSINKTKGLELNVANRLWGDEDYKFSPTFIKESQEFYGAGMERIDFKDMKKAAKTINTWVEDKTKDKIKDLLQPSDLEDAKLVLTNAIYFNASWALAFNKKETKDLRFFSTAENSELKSFMNIYKWKVSSEKTKYRYKYTEDKNVQVLEIPYSDDKASMVVLLPKDKEGLKDLLENLSPEQYTKWMEAVTVPKGLLNISLPKWKNTSDCALAQALKDMGMSNAFSNGANFLKMSDPKEAASLKISDVIHKAFIDVSEKGTEAAAATAVIMKTKSASVRPPVKQEVINFIADHPFLYFIKDNETNSILFMGQITNPKTE